METQDFSPSARNDSCSSRLWLEMTGVYLTGSLRPTVLRTAPFPSRVPPTAPPPIWERGTSQWTPQRPVLFS